MSSNQKQATISSSYDIEKNANFQASEYELTENVDISSTSIKDPHQHISTQEGFRLKKNLKARHVSMIAIGGALGTGLLVGSGSALANAGPAPLFLGYTVIGLIVYMVMCCLGEMATYIPLPEGFAGYASRYCDDALGFAVGYCYLFKYVVVTPNQITASAMVMSYWIPREKVNPGVWIAVFIVIIMIINIFGVKIFGEFEFWLSSLKVVVVLGLIILMFIIMLGGGPTHDRIGFRYWKDPGAFKPFTGIKNVQVGKFVSFVNVLVISVFAYLGTELVGVTVAEAENPRRNVPKAIKLTFFRILVFYICSVLLLGMCVPYNDPLLLTATKKSNSAAASPFVVAIRNAKIHGLDHLINACILIFILSGSNSDLYTGTRTLYGLAAGGNAPKIFARTNKFGIPYVSLAANGLFCCLAFMTVSNDSAQVFAYFVNCVSIFGLLTWISILVTHVYFRRALNAQGVDIKSLAYTAPFQPYGTYIAIAVCSLVALIKNFTVFINGFKYKAFITGYIGIPLYAITYFGYKIIMKSKVKDPSTVDLYSLKLAVDLEEEEGKRIEEERREYWKNGGKRDLNWYYDTFLSWIF